MSVIARRVTIVLATIAVAFALASCTAKATWVDSGNSYTLTQAREALAWADSAGMASQPAREAKRLRLDALVSLRNRGGSAAKAADLITATFPPDTVGVPTYVELARVDGKKALIIVEAWGPADGKLGDERLWVIDAQSGAVLDSAAVQ